MVSYMYMTEILLRPEPFGDIMGYKFAWSDLIYVAVILIGAVLSCALTPLMRRLALKVGAVDRPDGKRKLQREPVPYFGGIAIVAAFLATGAVALALMNGLTRSYAVIAVGALMIAITGVIDDVFDMKPYVKFLIEIAVALATVLLGGAIEYVYIFGVYINFGIFSVPLTVLWIVLVTNSVNMMDGLDGLACGISSIALMAFLVSAIANGDVVSAVVCGALCGAALGFLPYNLAPASIFMGDAGALSLGYVMATVSVFGFFKGQAFLTIVVPTLVLALPVTDAVRLFFVRISKGRNPFSSDRLHIHHRLVDMGMTPRGAVLVLYVISLMFGVAAVIYMVSPASAAFIIFFALVALALIRFAPGILTERPRTDARDEKSASDANQSDGKEDDR